MPKLYLADNGVTIRCEGGYPGFRQKVKGREYTVVDLETLKNHIFIRADLSRFCISLLTDLSEIFKNLEIMIPERRVPSDSKKW
jgi:hypothetical protein